jgi:excisionase family DNA binding protein
VTVPDVVERPVSDWLTLSEIATELKVSERTAQRWIVRGKGSLLAVRIGGVVRVRRSVLERWLRAREH